MKRFSSFLITLFFVIACQSEVDVTQTIPADTATAEITLTSTSQPTLPPQATPTQTLSIEFPDWVKNPNTQILLVPVGTHEKGYENMAVFNAETGERFDIPFTEEVGDYFWMPDGSAFGFLFPQQNKLSVFSIKDEIVKNISINKETLEFLAQSKDRAEAIQISTSNITDSNFLFLSLWDPLSSNGRYFIYQENYDETYTSVLDIYTREALNISDPNDAYIDLHSEWSPTSSLLAIVEVDEIPEMWNEFTVLPTFRLRVYDVESQETIASYKNITFPTWSPDGTKFLFQEWKKVEDDYYYDYKSSPPCIYDTVYGTTNCYYEALTEEINQFSSLDWSPNQSMIGYINSDKGFCTIILSNTILQCILENLDPNNPFVDSFSWSPDSNFISFEYGSTGAYSDDVAYRKLGIANIGTGEYFSIGDDVTYPHLGLWRPLPNP